jgi:DNA-binding NtrC family response regulator
MPPSATRRAHILVIDDNVELASVLAQALRLKGHVVWQTDSSKHGVRLLQENPIDILITDLVMPEQDGLETIQLALKLRPEVRIIAMSGDAPRYAGVYLNMAEKLGAHCSLLKPFRLEALFAAIEEVFPPPSDDTAEKNP